MSLDPEFDELCNGWLELMKRATRLIGGKYNTPDSPYTRSGERIFIWRSDQYTLTANLNTSGEHWSAVSETYKKWRVEYDPLKPNDMIEALCKVYGKIYP